MTQTELEHLMTRFRLGVFKLNGLLLTETEHALDSINLTRSRTRLLGVLVRSARPLTIPQICHEMGQTRQGVGRLVALLAKDGFLEYRDNPIHQKSKLIALTDAGKEAHRQAEENHLRLSREMPFPVSEKDLATATKVIDKVIDHLESSQESY